MSGESKRNPLSPDFAGQLPPIYVEGEIVAQLVPSKEWLDENRAAILAAGKDGSALPSCPQARGDVAFRIVGGIRIPMQTVAFVKWPAAHAPVVEIHRMPWPQFRDLIIQENPEFALKLNTFSGDVPLAGIGLN